MTSTSSTQTSQTAPDYDGELDRLYAAITNRAAFRYNASADPLYAAYADRYIQNGRMAMRDSMGQAAALTGGYGSSYSAAVGQQEYDSYLQALGEVMPQLYDRAYQRYTDEGDALLSAYQLTSDRADTAYARERDAIEDARYDTEAQISAEKLQYQRAQDSYNSLVKLISTTGYKPTDGELTASGLTRAQAEALLNQYLRDNDLLPGQSSSYSGSSTASKKTSASTTYTGTAKSLGATISARPSYRIN